MGITPASAETAAPAVAAAAAPACVKTSLNDSGVIDHLKVTNTCAGSKRVKVVLAWATDFACQTIPAGYYVNYSWSAPGRFDRLENC